MNQRNFKKTQQYKDLPNGYQYRISCNACGYAFYTKKGEFLEGICGNCMKNITELSKDEQSK